jgi:hypothetical protein
VKEGKRNGKRRAQSGNVERKKHRSPAQKKQEKETKQGKETRNKKKKKKRKGRAHLAPTPADVHDAPLGARFAAGGDLRIPSQVSFISLFVER